MSDLNFVTFSAKFAIFFPAIGSNIFPGYEKQLLKGSSLKQGILWGKKQIKALPSFLIQFSISNSCF